MAYCMTYNTLFVLSRTEIYCQSYLRENYGFKVSFSSGFVSSFFPSVFVCEGGSVEHVVPLFQVHVEVKVYKTLP